MTKVQWEKTAFSGVRFRRHSSRKHGVKFDTYFAVRYQAAGERREEGLGWASEGWTAEKAALELAKLKKANRLGMEGARLTELRETRRKEKEAAAKASMTFETVFTEKYLPVAKADKGAETMQKEDALFRLWICPVIGKLPLAKVAPIHLEKIKQSMKAAGRSDRYVQYALAICRQVFNFAERHGLFQGKNPIRQVKIPVPNNQRHRFLTAAEAAMLLDRLKAEDLDTYEMALISLHTGLRASEVFKLRWVDIDLAAGLLRVKDPKNKRGRVAYMTRQVRDVLSAKQKGAPDDLLYPGPTGIQRREIPGTFARVVEDLGFNRKVMDRRDRVVFHSLRHSYASWLVQQGTDLYTIQDRMGHSSLAMVQRYAHLAPEGTRQTVGKIEEMAEVAISGTNLAFQKSGPRQI